MNRKKFSLVIVLTALILIGARGVCMAQFSIRAALQKSEALVSKSTNLPATHTVQLRHEPENTWDQRNVAKFVFRVKKFALAVPVYQRIRSWEYGDLSPEWDRKSQTVLWSQSGDESPPSKESCAIRLGARAARQLE